MVDEALTAERFVRAAMLGAALAAETQRILRRHASDADSAVEVPFPDSTVVAAVLDAAAGCFDLGGASPEEARQAVLRPVLDLAALA